MLRIEPAPNEGMFGVGFLLIKSIFLFEREGYLENWLCILLLKIWRIIIKIVLDF